MSTEHRGVTYKKAILQDVVDIKDTIRDVDVREMYEFAGVSSEVGLTLSYIRSDLVWTMFNDRNEIVGMIGVTPHDIYPHIGVPWMLCTNLVEERKTQIGLLKGCKPHVGMMYDLYPTLTNFVHKDNYLAIRWLKWIGFTFQPPIDNFIQFIGVRD